MPVCTVCIENAGMASAMSRAVARPADRAGRLRTRVRTAFHRRLSPSARLRRCRNGTRPLSTRSPSQASIAGTTVIEPIIATATTMIAPMPSDVNVRSPASSMPAIAAMTVKPDTRTARPEVAAAVWTASSLPAPLAFSSRSRRR